MVKQPNSPLRLAAVAVQERKEEKRKVTGASARERLLQVVLALIAAQDAEAAARAEKAIDVTPPRESHTEAETVVTPPEPDDDCDGELA